MIPGAFIYRTSQEIEGLYDHFAGGLFYVKGLPLLCQLLALTSFLLAAYFGRVNRRLSVLFSLLGFTAFVVLLHQPWDELFVNLTHSKHFARHGIFSFHPNHPIEGTVDTLPYLVMGLLHKLGLPLVELALSFSLLGGMLCIFVASACIKKIRGLDSNCWPTFFLSLYSPLLFNSAHGFSTTLFATAILSSFYFIDLKKQPIGWWILALVPLIRTEGLWIVLLFLIRERKMLKALVLIPAALLAFWRLQKFGFLTPVPMHYKATFGNLFFFLLGLRNLWCDLLASYSLIFLLFYFLLRKREKILDQWLILCFIGVIPYYLSGGDWFPAAWGRYLLPFSLVACIAFFSTFDFKAVTNLKPLVFASLLFLVLPSSSYVGLFEDVFTKKKTLSNTSYRASARTNFRIQYLSQVGTHLSKVTAPTDVIGTSEMATIHYFADRHALDLLGITNEEIAKQPLRTPELFRRFPKNNELPYLIFRRVDPTLVEKHKPAVVYPFDFILKDLMDGTTFQEMDTAKILQALARWEHRFKGLMDPLYGGTEKLLALGYQPFIVLYENEFATLYFVEKSKIEEHQAKLKDHGFSGEFYKRPS